MKKLLIAFGLIISSIHAYSQNGYSSVFLRVTDSATFVNSANTTAKHAADYADIWYSVSSGLFWKWSTVTNTYTLLGAGGVSTFEDLTDGPGAFSGNTLKYFRVNTGGTALEYRTPAQTLADIGALAATATTLGAQDLFISSAAMWPRTTAGSSLLAKTEMTTSLFNVQTLDFDQTTQEFAQFQVVLPRNWNNGTITAVVYWTASTGTGTVQWGISGGAYSNDDALTVAFGTPQTTDDTLLATSDLHITPATSAIILAGTPADADFIALQISRNPGSDTLTGDARLLGVRITITLDAGTSE